MRTSSKISSMPCLSHNFLSPMRNPGGGQFPEVIPRKGVSYDRKINTKEPEFIKAAQDADEDSAHIAFTFGDKKLASRSKTIHLGCCLHLEHPLYSLHSHKTSRQIIWRIIGHLCTRNQKSRATAGVLKRHSVQGKMLLTDLERFVGEAACMHLLR
eukprot:1143495-Pelagomonas_calceolata.AAC.1